ncbi:hypothetical protein CN151_32050 [Sinorhizobium meliloti]|nr:hypothetical protein CDO30_19180 [Sinorhizobium meliloti]RVI51357.1 hypothetical protein CN195_14455 [Sinorhizobium meliloti]RVK92761.1 hypothetical protein CN151_32050 [Sinorhizobium meliloti]RVL26364.1 hypothetical protein CN147_14450 [Sinorhizobium meliloti]RVL40753.1 hypothetical protein CN146_25925 [Sinorhizobium meliloti]
MRGITAARRWRDVMALSNAALKRLRYLTFRADAPAPSETASSYGAELLLLGPERSIAGYSVETVQYC